MSRLNIPLSVILSFSISACTPMTNNRNETLLECGEDQIDSKYFLVEDLSGSRLTRDDIDFINLDNSNVAHGEISTKGCVRRNQQSFFILRNKKDDTSIIIDPKTELRKTITMEKSDPVMVDISCDSRVINTIGEKYRIKDLIVGNVDERLKKAIRLDFQFINDHASSSYSLLDDQKSENFITSQMNDGLIYEVKITVSNLMHKNAFNSKVCKFKKDTTAPNTILTINSNANYDTISWHDLDGIALVRSEQSINFTSDSDDVNTIEYCAKKLDDNFSATDLEKSNRWIQSTSQTNCESFEKVEVGQRFILAEKGFWSLNFRSIDAVGNISTIKKANLLLQSTSELEYIKAFAKTKALNALSEKRLKDAINEALASESSRRSLPTLYERNNIKNFTLSAMLNVLNNPILPIELEGREEYGRNAMFGKVSGKIYGMNKSNKVVIWDPKTHTIEREIEIPEEKNLDNIYVSSDEKQLLAQHTFKVDLIDLNTGKLIKTIFRSKGVPSAAHFTDDGKYIVVMYEDVLYTYDRNSLSRLHVTELKLGNRIWKAKDFVPHSTLILVNDNSSNIKLVDFLTGEVKEIFLRPDLPIVSSIKSTDDGKFFFIGDTKGNLEKWSIDSKNKTTFSKPHFSQVRGIQISADNKKVMSFTSDGEINIWSNQDLILKNTINDFRSPLYSAEFSNDGSEVVATAYESKPILWKIESSILIYNETVENITKNEFEWSGEDHLDISPYNTESFWTLRLNPDKKQFQNIDASLAYNDLDNDSLFMEKESLIWCLKAFDVRGIIQNICDDLRSKLKNSSKATKSLNYRILPGENKNLAIIYDSIKDQVISTIQIPDDAQIPTAQLTSDGKMALFETSQDILFVSTATGEIIWKKTNVGHPILSESTNAVIARDQEFNLYFYDLITGNQLSHLKWTTSIYAGWIIDRLHISRESGLLSFSNGGREISLWDLETKELLLNFNAPKNLLTGSVSAMNKSGTKIAYNMPDIISDKSRNILVWDIDHTHAVQKLCSYVQNSTQYLACK